MPKTNAPLGPCGPPWALVGSPGRLWAEPLRAGPLCESWYTACGPDRVAPSGDAIDDNQGINNEKPLRPEMNSKKVT